MSRVFSKWAGNWLVAGLFVVVASTGYAQTSSGSQAQLSSTVTVYIYNYAHVSRRTLNGAEEEASRILLKAGVEASWVDCPVTSDEIPKYPACRPHLDHAGLVLKIFPDFAASRLGLRPQNLGFCPASEEAGPGSEASISYSRVKDLANSWDANPLQILGFAAAHELGHLLLHSPGHSPTGIMRAAWNPEDLRGAAQGLLGFTPDQSERIRATARAWQELP